MNKWMTEAGVETSGAQTKSGCSLKDVAEDFVDAVFKMNAGKSVKFADADDTSMKAVKDGKACFGDFDEKTKRAEVFNGQILGAVQGAGSNLVGGRKYAGEKAESVVLNVEAADWKPEGWIGKAESSWKSTGLKSGPVFEVSSYVKGNVHVSTTTADCSLKSLATGADSQFESLCCKN